MPIAQTDLDNWFQYHAPKDDQAQKYERLRAAGHAMALVVLNETPASADQTVAIRKIREAVYTANAAIACGGR